MDSILCHIFRYFLLLPLLGSGIGIAEERVLSLADVESQWSIAKFTDFIQDPGANYDVERVRAMHRDGKFQVVAGKTINFGVNRSAWWMRTRLHNPSLRTFIGFVRLNNALISDFRVMVEREDGSISTEKAGWNFPPQERSFPHRLAVYPLQLGPDETVTVWMRMASTHPLIPRASILRASTFHQEDAAKQIYLGLFFGAMVVMFLYNFCIFAMIREKGYLLYACLLGSNIVYALCEKGFAFQFLWPNSPVWAEIAVHVFICFGALFGSLFTMHLLETRKTSPFWHRACQVVSGLSIFGLVGLGWLPFPKTIFTLFDFALGLIFAVALLGTGVRAWIARHHAAGYYTIAWGFFQAGVATFILTQMGVLPDTTLGQESMQIGSVFEVVLLSLALAARINALKKEASAAQDKLVLAVEQKNKTLIETNKLKDEFLANTSHELRTPLNGIVGIVEAMRQGSSGELSPQARYELNLVSSSARRLQSLINDLLDFSKLKQSQLRLRREPVDLYGMVQNVLALSEPMLMGKSVSLENAIPKNVWVDADPDRLMQVLHNLVGNAIKFTETGCIVVTAEADSSPQSQGQRIKVVDTGIGIAKEDLGRLFHNFEQFEGSSDRRFWGTGLGLSISQQLMELHGSHIEVESELCQGSTFSFVLPITSPGEAQTSLSSEVLPPSPSIPEEDSGSIFALTPDRGTGEVILAVDDEAINRHVIETQLRMHGVSVQLASSGKEALEFIEKTKPSLVLLDLMMPGMSGLEVCEDIRLRYSATELPIVMLTAKNQTPDLVSAFSLGANDYILKPFEVQELLARLRNQLNFVATARKLALREADQARLAKDLEASQAVQVALLPDEESIKDFDIAWHYESAEKTGGDWFHIHQDLLNNRLYACVGDVTGHGMPSALLTGVVCGVVRAYFERLVKGDSMAEVLQGLATECDQVIFGVGNKANRLMTMNFVGIDLATGDAMTVNAGHCWLTIVSSNGTRQLRHTGSILGMHRSAERTVESFTLECGEVLVLHTDGLLDNPATNGRTISKKQLRDWFTEGHSKTGVGMRDELVQNVRSFWQDAKPEDDWTLLLIRRKLVAAEREPGSDFDQRQTGS